MSSTTGTDVERGTGDTRTGGDEQARRENDTEERLIGLELKFTEQQALLEDVSGVVHEQQRELSGLRAELERLKGRLGAVEEQEPQAAAEKPPHY